MTESRVRRQLICLIAMTMLLGGCGNIDNPLDWFLGTEEPPLPGKRISVLEFERDVKPDETLMGVPVQLPRPWNNRDWPQFGGAPTHDMGHLALADVPRQAWRVDIGAGSDDRYQLLTPPVVAAGQVFTLDARLRASAYSAMNGQRIWRYKVMPRDDDDGFGGGLAYADGRLFIATGFGEVMALDAGTGGLLWRKAVGGPVRSSPTVAGGRVFVITVDNRLEVFHAFSGDRLWSHNGIVETATLLGSAVPAVASETAIVPYSSGELFALRVDNGRPVWSDNLATVRRVDAVSTLADIRGSPVVAGGRVFAVSHSGRAVAISLRTGNRLWDRDIGSMQTPWVAHDFVYIVTNEGEIVCITARDGRVRWISPLPRYVNGDPKKGQIYWRGPVLAGDRLIVASSEGAVYTVSPYTGKPLGQIKLAESILIPPVVADQALYILTDDGTLYAFR